MLLVKSISDLPLKVHEIRGSTYEEASSPGFQHKLQL